MLLSDLKPGQRAVITAVYPHEQQQRMLEMGLTPGEEVLFVRKAPLGDPIEIEIRGYSLCLRKSEASIFEVTV